jgi:DNA adenine methylase
LTRQEPEDFIYLDPPYAPTNNKSDTKTNKSFVGYTEKGFTIEHHTQLFKLIHTITDSKIIMSNADVELVRANFNEKYKTISILCKRSINSKNPEAKAKEVIIMNY